MSLRIRINKEDKKPSNKKKDDDTSSKAKVKKDDKNDFNKHSVQSALNFTK